MFDPQRDDAWEMYLLEYACSHEPWVGLVCGTHADGEAALPYSFVLLRRAGRCALIDCGFMQQGDRDEFPLKFSVADWISPLRLLAELGVTPAQVDDLVVTHAHFDHIGALAEFPNARLHLQRRELEYWNQVSALPRRFAYLTRIVDPANLRTLRDAYRDGGVQLLDGDADEVLPGVHVRLAAGHTPGHQLVLVDSRRGRRVVSGDSLYSTRQLDGLCGDGVYAPLANASGSLLEQLTTLDLLQTELAGERERLLVMHDVARWPALPVVAEVDGHKIVRVA